MQRKVSIKILTLLILIVIAFASILFSLPGINETAYAVLPESYETAVKDQNNDWQNGENYLNVSKIKSIVESLKNDYRERLHAIEESPIVVAVIDTGILATHDMFAGKYDENGKNVESASVGEYDVLLRDENGGIIGKNCVSGETETDLSDVGYHGTHVAGIIASYIHEFDLEKYIKIMPIKAATVSEKQGKVSFDFKLDDFKSAINYAVEKNADVVNMSLTAIDNSNFAINSTTASKSIFVAAAGNEGASSDRRKGYPAASDGVIGVMNYQQDGNGIKLYRSQNSISTNYGSVYDFAAPGGHIWNANATNKNNDEYFALPGTSMAAPVVSYGAALRIFYERLMSQDSKYDRANVMEAIRNAKYPEVTEKIGVLTNYTYKVFDFESILGNVDFAELLTSGELSQTVDSVTAISFTFSATGEKFKNGTVNWYADDVLIRENSRELRSYTPVNAVGKVTVKAVWTSESGSETQTFSQIIDIGYIPLDETTITSVEIKATEGGNAVTDYSRIMLGSTLTFYVSDNGKIEPADDGSIMWYVDGNYAGVGKSYNYLATRSGDHVIKVKINNLEAPAATFSVISETQIKEKETQRILGIVSIAVGIGIAVSLIILFAVVLDGKRRKKSKK